MVYSINNYLWSLFGNKKKKEDRETTDDSQQSSDQSITDEPMRPDGGETSPESGSRMSESDGEPPVELTLNFGSAINQPVRMLTKQHLMRRNSKRFVIGDEVEESEAATTPENEGLLTVPHPDWLKAAARLKLGSGLT